MIRLITGIALIAAQVAQTSVTARDQLADLRKQAHAARQTGDKPGYVQAALKVQELLNDAPDAVESVAYAYSQSGDTQHALDELQLFADMGQADDSLADGTSKAFAPLTSVPRYKQILEQFGRNKAPVSKGETAFTLADPGLVAEDISFDPHTKSLLITSVLEKKIIRVTEAGVAIDFAHSPSGWPMLAIKVDSARKLVWATEVALDGFSAASKSDWGRSAVLCFDLASGKLLRRIEGPQGAALGDMVLDRDGDPILSDGAKGGIYRVSNGKISLINSNDFISPQTGTLLADGIHVLVPDYLRGIGVLDLGSGRVEWLKQNPPSKIALNGIDGLYFDRGSLLITQNGTSPERVLRVRLDRSLTTAVDSEIIERSTPTLGDPTHGVVVGDTFYYIANSGWNVLDEHGNLKPGARFTPARVMRFRLK